MQHSLSQMLPSEDRQDFLIEKMATLISKQGSEQFVSGFILQPNNTFFPDVIQPNIGGVRRLIFRLMVYAGIGNLHPRLELYDSGAVEPGEDSTDSIAGWFAGIENNQSNFGMDVQESLDVDSLAGILSHEVAHAYRRNYQLEETDMQLEEELTDLTSVYLGFGILTANASYIYRTGSEEGYLASSYWSEKRLGYLKPQELCYLLAMQLTVLGVDSGRMKELTKHLDTTQFAMFSESFKLLNPQRDTLCADLGLPIKEWPDSTTNLNTSFQEQINQFKPLPGDSVSVLPEEDDEDIIDSPTFRVVKTRSLIGLALSMMLTVTLAIYEVIEGGSGVLIAFSMFALGLWIGSKIKYYQCSTPECGRTISLNDAVCRKCKRPFAGTINHIDDRLGAEDELKGNS